MAARSGPVHEGIGTRPIGEMPNSKRVQPGLSAQNAVFESITAARILSFGDPPVSLSLKNLNILIGSNGTGKSNLIEIFGLLHSLPTDISDPFRIGGGVDEWMWRGAGSPSATCEVDVCIKLPSKPDPVRYSLKLRAFQQRPEIADERIEFTRPRHSEKQPYFFYQFQDGRPVINVHDEKRSLKRETHRDCRGAYVVIPLILTSPSLSREKTLRHIRK